jgi:endonuclease-3
MNNSDIHRFISILNQEYTKWEAPVLKMISKKGASVFEILISTVLSLRTKDDVTINACQRLFEKANTPEEFIKMDVESIKALIYPVGFYHTKASRIKEISELLIKKYNGNVPDDINELLKLPGVGRKTANLVLIEGFGKKAICVDTHVHRISNRTGYIKTRSPEKTEFALRKKLPRRYWIKYNEILVAFGQTICRPVSPFCSKCPVSNLCKKVNVTKSR